MPSSSRSVVTPTAESAPEAALFAAYRATGDVDVRNEIVLRYRWLARRCAASMDQRGVPMADLVQVAEVGLIKAVERFDPSRGVVFPTFATPTMLGEIRRYFRDHTWAVGVPRRAKDARTEVRSAAEVLHQRLGRPPTVDEIAAHCRMNRSTVADALLASQVYRCSSLEQARSDGGDAIEAHAASALRAEDPLHATDQRLETMREVAQLPERLRKLILWRYFEECTQQEIGQRLGIGQVQVSRLLRKALDELHHRLVDRPAPSDGDDAPPTLLAS